jgi:hypothetical protein
MATSTICNLVFGAVVSILLATAAHAEVPKPEDFAACNTLAAEKVRDAPSAAPTADAARKGEVPPPPRRDDPQVQGIAADRTHDPAYVAEYRSCMRQRGF